MPPWATTWPASISRTPRFLGTLEPDSAAIAERAHARGALAVVGVDAISLGVLEAPPRYGADLVCGELQGLGIHMHYGGGTIGFIASADDERIVAEYPTFLDRARAAPSTTSGASARCAGTAWRTCSAARRATSPARRSASGRSASAVYLALLGPDGHARARHDDHAAQPVRGEAARRASGRPLARARGAVLQGVRRSTSTAPAGPSPRSTRALAAAGIHGPLDLSRTFAALGQSALVCVTEVHTQADIDRLADALAAAIA